nr:MAG TPA: hypothetical protein [Caudoviricetes sp.]
MSKNSSDGLGSYPRNIRFQCHRCDTISNHRYYITNKSF